MSQDITLEPIGELEATAMRAWRYPGEFAVYDFDETGLATLVDPDAGYLGIHRQGKCIGYVCVGAEARVPGLAAAAGTDDLGMGLAPALVGQGMSRWLIPAVIDALGAMGRLEGATLRAVVLDWNLRSQRALAAVGFSPAGEVTTANGRFVVLSRPREGQAPVL